VISHDQEHSANRLGRPRANLGSTLLFTLLLLSPFLWGAAVWHWLLAVAIGLVLGVYFYIRRERFEEPGPDADETRFPR
jgi:O-antigen/teichoic acid export membrane protein